ncbi:MAG: hypothetical protein ACRD4P_02445 [Bryobacteraceae bacterium]
MAHPRKVGSWEGAAHGRPPRKSYHDKQWASRMKEVGLYSSSSSTAAPGGKDTGQKVSHYVIKDGPFARSFAKLEATGFKLRWQSRAAADDPIRKKKAASKTKYVCPNCDQNAWASQMPS